MTEKNADEPLQKDDLLAVKEGLLKFLEANGEQFRDEDFMEFIRFLTKAQLTGRACMVLEQRVEDLPANEQDFAIFLGKKGYKYVRQLEDGSWAGLLLFNGMETCEIHTGLDYVAPRKRFFYPMWKLPFFEMKALNHVNDEPEGAVRKVAIPRYLIMRDVKSISLKGCFELGALALLNENEDIKERHPFVENFEIFPDDDAGNGLKQFVERATAIGAGEVARDFVEMIPGNRNWNHIKNLFALHDTLASLFFGGEVDTDSTRH